jgi:hypothetical protein
MGILDGLEFLGTYEFVVKDVDDRCFIMFVLASSEEEARSKVSDFAQVCLCKVVNEPAILCSLPISAETFKAVVEAVS